MTKRKPTSASWKKGNVPWNRGIKYSNKPVGFWSRFFLECKRCGSTKIAHQAHGLCKNCYYTTDEQHKTQKKYREFLKHEAFVAYSGKYPFCACCKLKDERFLSIDHVDGCGVERRKKEPSGSPMYAFLRKNNYPEGYQILCHNCNMAKQHYGECPHKTNETN
jgi:hypothetical protein